MCPLRVIPEFIVLCKKKAERIRVLFGVVPKSDGVRLGWGPDPPTAMGRGFAAAFKVSWPAVAAAESLPTCPRLDCYDIGPSAMSVVH